MAKFLKARDIIQTSKISKVFQPTPSKVLGRLITLLWIVFRMQES